MVHGTGFGFKLGRIFVTFDEIGFHAGISGTRYEVAWTDEFGWVWK